jgi:ASC-1-like (ASCH) protein
MDLVWLVEDETFEYIADSESNYFVVSANTQWNTVRVGDIVTFRKTSVFIDLCVIDVLEYDSYDDAVLELGEDDIIPIEEYIFGRVLAFKLMKTCANNIDSILTNNCITK